MDKLRTLQMRYSDCNVVDAKVRIHACQSMFSVAEFCVTYNYTIF